MLSLFFQEHADFESVKSEVSPDCCTRRHDQVVFRPTFPNIQPVRVPLFSSSMEWEARVSNFVEVRYVRVGLASDAAYPSTFRLHTYFRFVFRNISDSGSLHQKLRVALFFGLLLGLWFVNLVLPDGFSGRSSVFLHAVAAAFSLLCCCGDSPSCCCGSGDYFVLLSSGLFRIIPFNHCALVLARRHPFRHPELRRCVHHGLRCARVRRLNLSGFGTLPL